MEDIINKKPCGEQDLDCLLASMEPQLLSDEFVFCSFPTPSSPTNCWSLCQQLNPLAMFREGEGLSLVVSQSYMQTYQTENPSLSCTFVKSPILYSCITLTIHSSLEAVGLTAAVATALAKENISANVIAAYFHDHIFVPSNRAKDALQVLQLLQQQKQQELVVRVR